MTLTSRPRFRPSLEIDLNHFPLIDAVNATPSPSLTPLTGSSAYSAASDNLVITPYNPHKSFELEFRPTGNAGDFFFTFERPYSALKRTVLECRWDEESVSPSSADCSPTLGTAFEDDALSSDVGPTPPPKTPAARGHFFPETATAATAVEETTSTIPKTPELDYSHFEADFLQSPSEASTPRSTPPIGSAAITTTGQTCRSSSNKVTRRSASSSLLSPIPIFLDTIPEGVAVPSSSSSSASSYYYTKQLPDRPLREQPLPSLPAVDLMETHYKTTTTTTTAKPRLPRSVNTKKLERLLGPMEEGIDLAVLPFNFSRNAPAVSTIRKPVTTASARHALYEMI